MTPFHDRCPEAADSEMLVLHIKKTGLPLPPGEYGFFEWCCDDPDCDCRRAVLRVISPQHPGRILATLIYGWESVAFYTEWMHGDAEAGHEITSASLDPINPQSELAGALLDGFRDYVRRDAYYPQQLQRHYEQFKSTLRAAPTQAMDHPPIPPMTTDDIIRQLRRLPARADFAPYAAALLAAIAQREGITPELLAAIDRVTADPAPFLRLDNEDYLHSFATSTCWLSSASLARSMLSSASFPCRMSKPLTLRATWSPNTGPPSSPPSAAAIPLRCSNSHWKKPSMSSYAARPLMPCWSRPAGANGRARV